MERVCKFEIADGTRNFAKECIYVHTYTDRHGSHHTRLCRGHSPNYFLWVSVLNACEFHDSLCVFMNTDILTCEHSQDKQKKSPSNLSVCVQDVMYSAAVSDGTMSPGKEAENV